MQLCPIPIPFPLIGTTLCVDRPEPERVDRVENRLGLAAVRCWDDDAPWRRFAMWRVVRFFRRIMQALSEPLSDDDANAYAAIADLRRIHRTLGAMIKDHVKLMKARAAAREPSIFDPP